MTRQIRAYALQALSRVDPCIGASRSLLNYRTMGVDRIWLSDTISCLVTDSGPCVSDHNIMLQNRIYDTTIVSLSGLHENVVYEVVIPGCRDTAPYHHYKIDQDCSKPATHQGIVYLQRKSTIATKSYLTKASVIHRLVFREATYTLLYEDKDPLESVHSYIDAYVDRKEAFPAKLYQTMGLDRYRKRLVEIATYLTPLSAL